LVYHSIAVNGTHWRLPPVTAKKKCLGKSPTRYYLASKFLTQKEEIRKVEESKPDVCKFILGIKRTDGRIMNHQAFECFL